MYGLLLVEVESMLFWEFKCVILLFGISSLSSPVGCRIIPRGLLFEGDTYADMQLIPNAIIQQTASMQLIFFENIEVDMLKV